MNDPVQYVYSSLFNHLDDTTFTGKCSLLDVLNNTNDSTLKECKQTLYNFYTKYFDKLDDIKFCLNVIVYNENLKTVYVKDTKIKGEIKDDDINKLVKDNENLQDVFVSSIERDNCATIFKYYEKVFNPHSLDKGLVSLKEDSVPSLSHKTIRSNTEPATIVKTEVKAEDVNEKESFSLIGRSQTEVKKSDDVSRESSVTKSDSKPKKEWSAPKAKQRGLDSMFKRKAAKPAVSTPIVKPEEEPSTMTKEKKLEERFQFTTKTLIGKRREDESKKEEDRMKIIQERLNNMSKAKVPVAVKRERTEEVVQSEPKKAKVEEKPMDDIFNSDSDYMEEDDIKPLSPKIEGAKISIMETSEPKESNISMSMASDSTGFMDLVLNNDKGKKKGVPAMVLESDSQDSSDDN